MHFLPDQTPPQNCCGETGQNKVIIAVGKLKFIALNVLFIGKKMGVLSVLCTRRFQLDRRVMPSREGSGKKTLSAY